MGDGAKLCGITINEGKGVEFVAVVIPSARSSYV
jgi:hypothetical protein